MAKKRIYVAYTGGTIGMQQFPRLATMADAELQTRLAYLQSP